MLVLHLITGLHAGGAEQQVASLLEHTRHDAEVVTMYAPGIMAHRLVQLGVRVRDLNRPHQLDLRALPELVWLMRRGRYDAVHTHLYRACVYGRTAARVAGVRTVVATEHSLGDTQIEGRPTTWPVRRLYLASERLGDHTIAVSGAARRRLEAWGVPADRISVIPNGLDTQRYAFDPSARRRERTALRITDHQVVFGTVGRLHPIKRHDMILDGVAPLLRAHDARLLVVGWGKGEAALRERAIRLEIAAQVHFLGERADVTALLSAMDIFVAPSTEETFGLAVVEALCSGLPAVVGACPAIDDLELPGVVRCDDAVSLQTGLYELHRQVSAGAAPSRRCPAAIAARMDIGRVVADVDDLYQNVGTSRRGPALALARVTLRGRWR
jgi:glycosyltransferase involved in cell wall biosynthesis